MEVRKGKWYRVFVFLLVILLVGLTYLPSRSFAGDMEIMVDEMVKQGVITREQGDRMLKGMQERKTKEQEKAKAKGKATAEGNATTEGKATEPDWVKNIPDWIKNPPDWVKNIKFSGDFRLRYDRLDREPLESSTDPDIDRNRGRFRLRLGAETKVFDNVTVGFGIASSENGNPRSNNQTFNSEWSKKSISINYAYVDYKPLPWLSISGGKLRTNPIYQANSLGFGNTFFWDPDITPEGVALVLNQPNLLELDGVSLDVFMNNALFIVDEFSTGREPYMFVFQPGFNLKIMKDFNFKAAVAYYGFSGIKNEPLLGNQPGAGNTNTLFTSGPLKGSYKFNYNTFAANGELGYMTPFPDLIPYVGVFGEFIRNTDSHDEGWQAGVRVGSPSLKKLGDWQLAYAYRRLERDAWLDIFNDDDFYQGQTNVKGHYIWGALGITKNISFDAHYYHGTNILGAKQPEDRILVDLLLKF